MQSYMLLISGSQPFFGDVSPFEIFFSAEYPLTSAKHFWLKERCNTQYCAISV